MILGLIVTIILTASYVMSLKDITFVYQGF
jgi:hypothetical protein